MSRLRKNENLENDCLLSSICDLYTELGRRGGNSCFTSTHLGALFVSSHIERALFKSFFKVRVGIAFMYSTRRSPRLYSSGSRDCPSSSQTVKRSDSEYTRTERVVGPNLFRQGTFFFLNPSVVDESEGPWPCLSVGSASVSVRISGVTRARNSFSGGIGGWLKF